MISVVTKDIPSNVIIAAGEIANANSEMTSFINEVEKEVDALISEEEAKSKGKVNPFHV